MPRVCSICSHPERAAIDKAIAAGAGAPGLSTLFHVSDQAIYRHRDEHLPAELVRAVEAERRADALDVMAELRRCFERVNLLFDACDRWLRDPADPSRYDIGPRAEELMVTYQEAGAEGRPVMRKAPLSRLLAKVEGQVLGVVMVETKHADPRDLVLKAADRLRHQSELLARLIGELDDRPQINLLLAPEWLEVRAALLEALAPFPDARAAVAERLLALEAA